MTQRDWIDVRWAFAVMLWGVWALLLAGGAFGCRRLPDPQGCGYGQGWHRDARGKVVCE